MKCRLLRLRRRPEFIAVSRFGEKARRGSLVLQRADGTAVGSRVPSFHRRYACDSSNVLVGFTVTKRVGTATERNRVRRRLREAFFQINSANSEPVALSGVYVAIGRRLALSASFQVLVADLVSAAKQLSRYIS